MKLDLENHKAPPLVSINPVVGSSTINHQVRTKLCLSMEEYVILDYIERCHRDSKPVEYVYIYSNTGIEHDVVKILFEVLWGNGWIETSSTVSKFKPTKKWYDGFSSTKNEFEEFWQSLDFSTSEGKKKISWSGAKADALDKFAKARKVESFEYLMAQKLAYFKMIASSDYRQVMGCSVFLNVTTKRYSEDWEKQTKKDVVHEVKETKKITVKDVRSKY